ncbi:MAG: site-2 protease family protein [Phycisphaeraceae bacterium]|nr:site-2 protease family protein [Phycisphaerae bacterium]MBX3391399.1 site-2 protease family protein [Phycisphaeraceae bacterium]
MDALISFLGTAVDLTLVILGFSLIIFLHELGHFLAARWAGIRVLSFALGFGPAVVSYRTGMGWRRGSGEREYFSRLSSGARPPGTALSPTEYRLNALPLGGYVRMLGQDDLDPASVSGASDSYQSSPIWKRMIVISAGVAMNIASAAAIFVLVFMIGLRTEPARIGDVEPGSPAATTAAVNAGRAGAGLGSGSAGLQPGDEVVSINGRAANSFNDLVLATAMARRGDPVVLVVRREGISEDLEFHITPRQSTTTKLLDIGVGPALSANLAEARNAYRRSIGVQNLERIGLSGVTPGMSLVEINGRGPVASGHELDAAIRGSRGRPVALTFASKDGGRTSVTLPTRAELELDLIPRADGSVSPQRHLAGLTPVMSVREAQEPALKQGIRDGDIFARLGEVEYPSVARGMQEIKRHAGGTIAAVLLRQEGDGWSEVSLDVSVSGKGTIGFFVDETDATTSLVSLPPDLLTPAVMTANGRAGPFRPAAAGVVMRPGSRIVAVNANPAGTLGEVRDLIRTIAVSALAESRETARVRLTIEPPRLAGAPNEPRPTQDVDLTIGTDDIFRLVSLTWSASAGSWIFTPQETTLRADGPLSAVGLGIAETHRVMMTTYVTFARLFEGTVKVEHLKGPVGIAHIGTRLADRGVVWLLFFMALISVNLAVVNFLPLPIVDGGQFIFLVIEKVRGRPLPIPVQNAVALAGLLLIGSVFLIVTFNDIRSLIAP